MTSESNHILTDPDDEVIDVIAAENYSDDENKTEITSPNLKDKVVLFTLGIEDEHSSQKEALSSVGKADNESKGNLNETAQLTSPIITKTVREVSGRENVNVAVFATRSRKEEHEILATEPQKPDGVAEATKDNSEKESCVTTTVSKERDKSSVEGETMSQSNSKTFSLQSSEEEQREPKVQISGSPGKEISFSLSESIEKIDSLYPQHKNVVRVSSKDSFQERRRLSKKYSTASNCSFGGVSAASSFSDSPYIHLMNDDKDRRSSESGESSHKRKISEGPSAFIRMHSNDDHEFETEFMLGKLEVNEEEDEIEEEDAGLKAVLGEKPKVVSTKPIKSVFKPPKPPRQRLNMARQMPVTAPASGGSKVFEKYEAEMRSKFGKDNKTAGSKQRLASVTEKESGKNEIDVNGDPLDSHYLTVQSLTPVPFRRGVPARSTICLAQIENQRRDSAASEGSKTRKQAIRSSSFRRSVQRIRGEVTKTFKNLTGK